MLGGGADFTASIQSLHVSARTPAAEDYSWLQYVGLRGDGLSSRLDLRKLGTRFELPMYFVQGEEDLVAVPEVSRRYYDSIEAPDKEWVLLPRTGHDPNPAMVAAQYELLKRKVTPQVK